VREVDRLSPLLVLMDVAMRPLASADPYDALPQRHHIPRDKYVDERLLGIINESPWRIYQTQQNIGQLMLDR
jgi:hypothetical protein